MTYAVAATNTLGKPILQALTSASSTAAHDVGYTTKSTDGREYTYQYVSTNMTAAGTACAPLFYLSGAGVKDVSTTYTAGDLGRNFAGLICTALAAGDNYVWAQTDGFVPSALLSSNVAAGETLTCMESLMLTDVLANTISTNIASYTLDAMNVGTIGTALTAYAAGYGTIMLSKAG